MKITDEDLFYYFKHKSNLDTKKINFIKKNLNLFEDQIVFFRELSKADVNINEKTKNKLTVKVASLSKQRIVKFTKVKHNLKAHENSFKLAADNIQSKSEYFTETYLDQNNDFMLKVISNNDETRIYLFNKDATIIENYILTIYPNQKTYECINSLMPIITNRTNEIDHIIVEFKLV